MDLNELYPDELEGVARRKRENAKRIEAAPSHQREVAEAVKLRLLGDYDEAYLLPCVGLNGPSDQLMASAYRYDNGVITHVAEVYIYPTGSTSEMYYRIEDLGPDGCGGRRTRKLWTPGKCVCHVGRR